jgi:hypothetical protein
LQTLIRAREQAAKERRAGGGRRAQDAMAADLDYLFGTQEAHDPVEALERKFWALMRLMAKKGLITPEEFSQELDQD